MDLRLAQDLIARGIIHKIHSNFLIETVSKPPRQSLTDVLAGKSFLQAWAAACHTNNMIDVSQHQ